MFAGGVDVDGTIFDAPELRVAGPAVEGFAVEQGGEALIIGEAKGNGLAAEEAATTAGGGGGLGGQGEGESEKCGDDDGGAQLHL